MTARVALLQTNYGKPEQAGAFYKKLLDRLSSEPGMQSVAAAWYIPLSGSEIGFTFNFDAHPVPQSQQPAAQFNAVTADYFKTMRVPLRKGRWFAERDDKNAPPVAIVTEAFAKQFSPVKILSGNESLWTARSSLANRPSGNCRCGRRHALDQS